MNPTFLAAAFLHAALPADRTELVRDSAAPPIAASELAQQPGEPALQEEGDSGEIIVTASRGPRADDPIKDVNVLAFAVTEEADKIIIGPAARTYKHIVPKPIRVGFRNFLNNLREPVVAANYLLQLKPGKAGATAARFGINSTLGIAGVVDVAKRCPFYLPWHPNGFGDTLGVYGVKPGPFIFVPLLGPTTVRDIVGGVVDRLASPIALGGPFRSRPYLTGSNVYRILDHRAEQEDTIQAARATGNPYTARRDAYLQKRQARIERLKGGVADAPAHERGGKRCRIAAGGRAMVNVFVSDESVV